MELDRVLQETIENWPDVPAVTHWTLVALPFLTLAACCLWLRVLWPCPEAAPKDFSPVSLAKGASAMTEGTLLQHSSNGWVRVVFVSCVCINT